MSQQLLETIRADVLRRLQLLMSDMSEDRLEDFHRAASHLPENYHEGIVKLILNQAVKLSNSEADFKRKIRHYYVIEYLNRQRSFQPLTRKVLDWFLVEEIVHASAEPNQLVSVMELMCAFEPHAPNEINSCLKQAYERTSQMDFYAVLPQETRDRMAKFAAIRKGCTMLEKMRQFHEYVLRNPPKPRAVEPKEGQTRIVPETLHPNAINLKNGEQGSLSNSNRTQVDAQLRYPGASQAAPPGDPRAPRPTPTTDGGSSQPGGAGPRSAIRPLGNGSGTAGTGSALGATAGRQNGSQTNGTQRGQDAGGSDDSNTSPEPAAGPVMPKAPPAKSKRSTTEGEYKIRKRNEQSATYLDKREPVDSDKDQPGPPNSKLTGDRLDPALTKTNLQSVDLTI